MCRRDPCGRVLWSSGSVTERLGKRNGAVVVGVVVALAKCRQETHVVETCGAVVYLVKCKESI